MRAWTNEVRQQQKTRSCSQLKEQHLNTHSKRCAIRGTHYLTPDAQKPAPTDRRCRHQAPARAWKPMLRQESLYPGSRNDHKVPFGRLHEGTATVLDRTTLQRLGRSHPDAYRRSDSNWTGKARQPQWQRPNPSLYIWRGTRKLEALKCQIQKK